MKTLIRTFVICIVMVIALFPVYAFASSNSGLSTQGEGASPISGWVISNVEYQLAADPSFLNSVTLDLNAAAATVSVKLSSKSTIYAACTNAYEYHWRCDFSGSLRVADMDELRVIAVGG